uniref:Uncharacterized protein n=1 Tax=Avena sativa TaxID=4498 RepID=A0ACD5V959_AVESA
MDCDEEHSLWSYSPSDWPDSYLLEEEALLSNLPFPSFCCEPLCSTVHAVSQSCIPQGELVTNFEEDVQRYWDSREESGEKGLPLLCYSAENGAASNTSSSCFACPCAPPAAAPVPMTTDRVRSEKVLTFELVSQYFYLPITQAARELKVGLTALKKRCRELGIPRWPHRKMKSLQALISNVEVLQEAGKANDDEQLRAMVETLEQERRLLEQNPCVELKDKTKRLRQACFKTSYKKRRVLALEAGEPSKYY